MFGLEHTLAYSPNMTIYHSNLLVQMRGARVKPYATAGIGGVFTEKDEIPPLQLAPRPPGASPEPAVLVDIDAPLPPLHSRGFGNKFAFNYGGGVKLFTTSRFGVRFDGRGYIVPNIEDPRQDQTLQLFEMSIGVVFSISK
jgi:hypothetical protein